MPDRSPKLSVVRRRSADLIARKGARRLAPAMVLAAICAVVVIGGVLLEQVVLAQSAFKMVKLRDRLAVAEARHEELLLRSAKLEAPGRIERVARADLEMVDPPSVQYIVADVPARSAFSLAQRMPRADVEDAVEESVGGAPGLAGAAP
ncbi:MAG: hypothetical protein ABR575_05890 [Actinomycetota bacterium]